MNFSAVAEGPAAPAAEQWPLGSRERAFWVLQQLVPDAGVSNIVVGVECGHPVDTAVLAEAVSWVVRRQPALRSYFVEADGVPVRRIRPASGARVSVEIFAAGTETLHDQIREFARPAFDLASDLLIRAGQFVLPDGGSTIAFAVHHIVFDGGSTPVFLEQVEAAFTALMTTGEFPRDLPPVPLPVVDPEPSQDSLAYWRERLATVGPGAMELHGARDLGQNPTFAGARLVHHCRPGALDALPRLRRELRASDNAVLLSLFHVLLAGHGAGPDHVVGIPLNLRRPEYADAVGYFVTTLALTAHLADGMTFRELVEQVRDGLTEGIGHADASFETVRTDGAVEGSWHRPVFRHMFNFLDRSEADMWFAGGPARRLRLAEVDTGLSRLDLEMVAERSASGLSLQAVYSTEVHTRQQALALLLRFESLLAQVAENPDAAVADLMCATAEDAALVDRANATAHAWPGASNVLDAVRGRALADPDAIAVTDGEERVSYRALLAAAERMRDGLVAAGVEPGTAVALAGPRGARTAAAALGIWAAGAHYLPLDPAQPVERLADHLADASVTCVVDGGALDPGCLVGRKTVVSAAFDATAEISADTLTPVAPLEPGTPAYVIFTSGSTGRPKGVRVSHGNLHNVTAAFAELLGMVPGESMLWLTTFSFDISALELFLPLSVGGSVLVAPDEARSEPEVLAALIAQRRPDILQATPTTWRLAAGMFAPGALAGTRVLCGGEPLPPALARRLVDTGCRLFNAYGPTETTIWSTVGEVTGPGPVTIGTPIANTRVHVLDTAGRSAAPGLPGELCIGGDGVTLGYLERPELTAERFVDHPGLGRLYRTGDRGYWTHDGELCLLGRSDRQVKVRGHRLEPGEIEAVLLRVPEVAEAAVAIITPEDDPRLVAFIRTTGPESPADDCIWEHIQKTLPSYAHPSRIVRVEALPITANDKVDYGVLAELGMQSAIHRDEAVAQDVLPLPEEVDAKLLDQLVGLWRTILKDPELGPTSHFFRNGGHSLLATRLAARVHRKLGVRVSIAEIYEAPTPLELAKFVRPEPV
ncbi:amino acid adenylation domain-containing protein [Streptomyces sp. NPDC059104]|uniref:non-ribosomal peptide synthetase n=1 Tax=Streptomyces sp. NPDC059104 TaxID=3346729 RepID=UPI0036C7923B